MHILACISQHANQAMHHVFVWHAQKQGEMREKGRKIVRSTERKGEFRNTERQRERDMDWVPERE